MTFKKTFSYYCNICESLSGLSEQDQVNETEDSIPKEVAQQLQGYNAKLHFYNFM